LWVAGRDDIAQVIGLAKSHGATGVALDFYFATESPDIDDFLCDVVLEDPGPVVAGARVSVSPTGAFRESYPPTLERCFDDDHRGHLLGTADSDNVIRHVPMDLGLANLPALSHRVAERILGLRLDSAESPPPEMIRYTEPFGTPRVLSFDSLPELSDDQRRELFADRVIFVGERSKSEMFMTPFGPRLGVQIHAASTASLVSGSWIRRLPWWAPLPVLLLACLLLSELAGGAATPRILMLTSAALTLLLLGSALISIRFWRAWVDVAYPIAAIWLLLPALLYIRKRRGTAGLTLRPMGLASLGSDELP
jgi:CHASE2 domain-containing sensor protein